MSEHASCAALLDRSLAELQERLERQRALVRTLAPALEQRTRAAACPLIRCEGEERYRRALAETIAVLEETRRSFKSRQLESLRKKLMVLLSEAPPAP